MSIKITTFALIAFLATSQGEEKWNGLTAKWDEDISKGFYDLPQTIPDAVSQGWTRIRGVEAPDNVTPLGYYRDPRIILLYNDTSENVIGIQIAILVKDIENLGVPINYTNNPAITTKTLNCEKYYTATAYFRLDQCSNIRKLWFLVNGSLVEIPTKSELVSSETSYLRKRCVRWMGLHYYKIDNNTDCSNIFPWFLRTVGDDVIGIGFQAIGNSTHGPKRKWFETIPPNQLAYTIPDAPACINEGVATYGVISFHIWFKKNPVDIYCSDQCTAKIGPSNGTEPSSNDGSNRKKRSAGSGNVC